MPKKIKKKKAPETKELLDVYESWLAKQPVRRVKGKSGFISASGTEATS